MAQIAKTTAAKPGHAAQQDAGGNVAELRQRAAADQAETMARRGAETVQRAADAARETQGAMARTSAEGTGQIGRALVELASEQAKHNVETMKALADAVDWSRATKAVDWSQVLRIQAAYLRASVERATRLTQGYVRAGQAAMTSAAFVARRQADKTA